MRLANLAQGAACQPVSCHDLGDPRGGSFLPGGWQSMYIQGLAAAVSCILDASLSRVPSPNGTRNDDALRTVKKIAPKYPLTPARRV